MTANVNSDCTTAFYCSSSAHAHCDAFEVDVNESERRMVKNEMPLGDENLGTRVLLRNAERTSVFPSNPPSDY